MKNKNKKKASLSTDLKTRNNLKQMNTSNEDKINLMKEFFKFTTVEPLKGEVIHPKKENAQRPNFNLKRSFKSSPLREDKKSSIESLLKQLIKDAVNTAVNIAVKEANSKKEKVISVAEENLNSSIQKIINTDKAFQNKVQDLYLLLSKEAYNISKAANVSDSSNKIDVSSEVTDEEKLRDIAIENNLAGAMHLFYPNETTSHTVVGHIDENILTNRLIQSSTTKSEIKKTKKASKKANRKQKNDKR